MTQTRLDPRPVAFLGALVALLSLSVPADAGAQIRASEPATVAQTIDGTKITIDYFRPKARGRSPLFGPDAVVWEHIWTPGANWSTKIAFEKPITVEGQEVEPGEYSVWMVMSEEMLPEELILHPNPKIFHTNPPDLDESVLRLPLEISEAPYREMLTWEFEDVRTDGATLALRWGEHRIPFEIGVEATMRQVATEEEAAPVVGDWTMLFQAPNGEEQPVSLKLAYSEHGTILADVDGMPEGGPTWMNDWDFIILPLADRVFAWGEARDGFAGEVWPGVTLEFDLEGDRATSFQMRDEEDEIMARGERAQ
jgi:hypothetical protein